MRSLNNKIKRAATNWLALPSDALFDVTRVTCVNAKEVVIEHVESLLHVSNQTVEVHLGAQILTVRGNGFEVTLISGREVHLQGEVASLEYRTAGGGRPR